MSHDTFLDTLLQLQPTMQALATRMLGDDAEAEDAVQETVIRLWERREQLSKLANLEGYTLRALRNHCIDLMRRQHPTVSIDESMDLIDEARGEAAQIEELAAKLDRMMEQLPEPQRLAVQMRYIDGATHEQMQQRLDMSSSNVYTTLSRAITNLKKMMKR